MPRDFVATFENQKYVSYIHTFSLLIASKTPKRNGEKREKINQQLN